MCRVARGPKRTPWYIMYIYTVINLEAYPLLFDVPSSVRVILTSSYSFLPVWSRALSDLNTAVCTIYAVYYDGIYIKMA